ncbi:zinc finger domain-containing protein [Nocardia sp. NPDC004278]
MNRPSRHTRARHTRRRWWPSPTASSATSASSKASTDRRAPAGSTCRTRGGKTAAKYHTARFILVPAMREELEIPVPDDRGRGRLWAPRAPVDPSPAVAAARPIRIGYARCSTASRNSKASSTPWRPPAANGFTPRRSAPGSQNGSHWWAVSARFWLSQGILQRCRQRII